MTRQTVSALGAMAFAIVTCNVSHAQQSPVGPPVPAQVPAPAPQQQFQPSGDWQKLPKMQLERQFAGPLQDTVIQRWRDPADGTICYIYLPISAPHSAPTSNGFVQYGATTIGSISCGPPPAPAAVVKSR